MKNFYTIVRISPNPNSGDALSVALIVWSNGKFFFKKSNRKLKAIRNLIKTSGSNLNFLLGQIESKLDSINKKFVEYDHAVKSQIPNLTQKPENPASISYFRYCHNYSNGLIQYSDPKEIDFTIDQGSFEKFFRVMVDSMEEDILTRREVNLSESVNDFSQKVNTNLIQPLSKTINTNITVSNTLVPDLYFEMKIDCLGKNGSIYSAKSFDFENVKHTVHDRQIGHYLLFASLFNQIHRAEKGKNHFYLIADEPSQIDSLVHQQWESVSKLDLIDVVPLEEAGKVAETITTAKAKKIF